MVVWAIALDLIQDVRGSIAMFLFIIEEAIQTVGMSCYLLYKEEKWAECLEVATYIKNRIIEPSLEFVDSYGQVAYPLNISYKIFYESAMKNVETYIKRCLEKLQG